MYIQNESSFWISLIVTFVIGIVGVGIFSHKKGLGFGYGFWFSFFLSPLIGAIVVAGTPAKIRPTSQPFIDWPRHFARLAMVAAVVCFLSQVAYAQLTAKEKQTEWTAADRTMAGVGISLLVSGVILAVAALVGAVRTKNYDTGVIAVIGLAINGGVLAFIAWYVLVVRPNLPLD